MELVDGDIFLSHVLRNFIEDQSVGRGQCGQCEFLSHVLRNFIEDANTPNAAARSSSFLSHVLRNFIEEISIRLEAGIILYS